MKLAPRLCAIWMLFAAGVTLVTPAQVVRVAGGVSSFDNGKGATAALYEGDSNTQVGVGYAEGFRVGLSREVRMGNASLTAGDTAVTLKLPTDLQDAPRIVRARGVLLQSTTVQGSTQVMAGVTGDSFGNAYLSTVSASNPIAVAMMNRRLGKAEISGLQIKGVRNSTLASVSYHPDQNNFFAVTTGVSAGSHILRLAVHHGDSSDRVDTSYTSGQLRLQPEARVGDANLERIGWNISATRHVKRWLFVDAGRHEYATSDASANPVWNGVTASRSRLLEAGASLRLPAGLQGTARIFQANSGPQHTRGEALLAGWRGGKWDFHVTSVHSATAMDGLPASPGSVASSSSRTTILDASQRVFPRLIVRESLNLSGNSHSMEFGGAYDGNRVNLSIGQREVFVPFGAKTGFHQMTIISVRLRLRDSQVGVDTVRGGGLPATYGVTAEGYYGELDGEHTEEHRAPVMPKFAVRGTVVNQAKEPVRAAAVAVGRQTVYTDSEGHFLARVERHDPVVVELRTKEFLTLQPYVAVTRPLTVVPDRAAEEHPLQLEATVAPATLQDEPFAPVTTQPDAAPQTSRLAKTLHLLTSLGKRMLHLPLHRSTALVQV